MISSAAVPLPNIGGRLSGKVKLRKAKWISALRMPVRTFHPASTVSIHSVSGRIGDPTGCIITLQPHDLTGDPGLATFTDNGRPGNGHFPLLPTSQAIDAGSDAVCPRRDQLGQRRIGRCDIGAIRFLDGTDLLQEDDA